MNITSLCRSASPFYWLKVLALFFFSINTYASDNTSALKNDLDSLEIHLKTCVCKHCFLMDLFWKYALTDNYEQVKPIGERAYEIIKNSKNLETLSDGYYIKGFIFEKETKFDSAYYFFGKALKIGTAIGYKFRVSWSYINLGRIDYLLGNYRSTFINIKKAEKMLTGKYDSISVISAFTNIYEQFGNYDSALIYLNKKLEIYKNNFEKQKELQVYFEIMNFYGRRNNINKTLEYLNKGLKLAESIKDDETLINTYATIGDFFFNQKRKYNIALEYYNKALEKHNKEDTRKALLYHQISRLYLAINRDSTALLYNFKSLGILKKLNLRSNLADTYEDISYTYKKLGNNQLALYYLKAYFEIGGCPDWWRLSGNASGFNAIADLYMKLNNPKEALSYYLKAFELAKRFHVKKEIAISNLKLGNYYYKINPKLSRQYYLSSLKTADEAQERELVKAVADTLSHYYLHKNNYKSAYHYYYLARVMEDSLSKMDRQANTAELEMKFVVEKLIKDNEVKEALSEGEIKRQRIYRNFLLLISGLLGILGIVIYLGYKRKKKDNLQLAIRKNEIETQKSRIEQISKKLHETDQAKLRFFTNISHEFRTPLTLILGPIEKLIKENANNHHTGLFLNIVRRNTYQLYHLINQLLDIRKLDTGNVRLQVSKGDITGFCKGICAAFNHLAEEHKITYTFTAGDNITGWFDRDILEKVLNNLISNAFKYTPPRGKISVTLNAIDKSEDEITQIKITVKDNGKGIPADQVQYVFNRYYQVEKYNHGFNTGTGIGLAYAKELIELHKGEVKVQSKINHGSTFTIILPVHPSNYDKNEIAITGPSIKENEHKDLNPEYLQQITNSEPKETPQENQKDTGEDEQVMLIIEDNPDVRIFIKSIFSGNFSIYEASDGLTGYQLANKLIPDIIISDIMMPEMDGLELCKKLKSDIHTNHIPILILTARAGDENEIEGLKTGADDYLTKPFNTEILEARVNGLISLKQKLREHFTRQFILNPKEIKLVSPKDEFLKKAVELVEDNITNPELGVDFLIKELGVSRTQLFRKLKATTNYSVSQFIRNIRLKRAAQLLQQESLNISEVLYLSGFDSRSHFTACFKEMYGCLPKEYSSKNDCLKRSL